MSVLYLFVSAEKLTLNAMLMWRIDSWTDIMTHKCNILNICIVIIMMRISIVIIIIIIIDCVYSGNLESKNKENIFDQTFCLYVVFTHTDYISD